MPRMRILLLSVILAFGFVLPLSAQNASEYSNDRLGISFSYPYDWKPEESAQKIVIHSPGWTDNAKEKAAFGILLTPLDYTEDKSVEEYFSELIQEGSYTYDQPDTVLIDGKEWLHSAVKETGDDVSGELFLLKYNHTLYVMVMAYQPSVSASLFLPALEKMVKSLKLTQGNQS